MAAADILGEGLIFDCIISSSLTRASETAKIIAEQIGYSTSEIIHSELFIERRFGMLEGTPRSEFFDAYSYQDIDNVPRAETLEQLHIRAQKAYVFLEEIPKNNILVVSHSAFYRALRRAVTGDPFSNEYTSPFQSIKNGKIYTIQTETSGR
jgi:broad specificity phosphatase PhoE